MEPNPIQALRSLAAEHRRRLISSSHIPIAIAELGGMGADAIVRAADRAAQKVRSSLPSLAVEAAVYGVAAATMAGAALVEIVEDVKAGVRDGLAELEKTL